MAESVHQHDTELSWKDTKDVATYTELSLELPAIFPVDDASEPIAFPGRRSFNYDNVDPRNLEEMWNAGVMKYSSPRNLPQNKLRHSEESLPSCGTEQQTDRTPSPDNRIHYAVGDRLMPDRNNSLNSQKLSLCEHKQDVHERDRGAPNSAFPPGHVTLNGSDRMQNQNAQGKLRRRSA
jgi:hypothetical protein